MSKQAIQEKQALIKKLQAEIEELKKVNVWEPTFTDKALIEFSEYKDYLELQSHAKLLAYVHEFGGDWVADWSDAEQYKWNVFYNNNKNAKWSCSTATVCSVQGTIHMSEDCARGLVKKLNSGEVVL